jgi:hypothetical protein
VFRVSAVVPPPKIFGKNLRQAHIVLFCDRVDTFSFFHRAQFRGRNPMGAISCNRPACTPAEAIMSPKLTSARAFTIPPNRLSAALKNRFFSIVRAKLITEEESGRRTPKLGLAGHHRKRLAAECATCPCNILEMADVHHIPPLSPQRSTRARQRNHAAPRCIADVPSRLTATRAARAEARPGIP